MAKLWTLVAHPGYFQSLRQNVPDPDERYLVVTAIWEQLQETDDPKEGAIAVPNEPGQYELTIRGYTLSFALPDDRPNDIDLLEVD